MNEESFSPVTPLDAMVSQDSLQLLKASVPYLPAKAGRMLSVYAKMRELSNTISLFERAKPEVSMMSSHPPKNLLPADILGEIRQYAGGAAREAIDQLLFVLNTLQLVQMYQENPENQEVDDNAR
ncbi:MAG TPA: hypothetical protein IAA57_00800 [Candidatus Pullilachnospira intestinigallinarum]|nr:hypothetical protein [Candidatus Pullilachnospira intestinigallinarum]